jgi:hypothetical protein
VRARRWSQSARWRSGCGAALDEARARLEQTDELERRAASLLFESATLAPAPPANLLAGLREEVAAAQVFRAQGREAIDKGDLAEATSALDRAATAYHGACQRLLESHLAARADAATAEVRGRAELYRSAATGSSRRRLAKLELALERLAPPAADLERCAAAEGELARIASQREAAAALAAVDAELARELPRVTELARAGAESARRAANQDLVEVDAFREALVAGRDAYQAGEARTGEEKWLEALDRFRAATASFEQARAIAPVAHLRARDRPQALTRTCVYGRRGLEADALRQQQSWADAGAAYQRAQGPGRHAAPGSRGEQRCAGARARAAGASARARAAGAGRRPRPTRRRRRAAAQRHLGARGEAVFGGRAPPGRRASGSRRARCGGEGDREARLLQAAVRAAQGDRRGLRAASSPRSATAPLRRRRARPVTRRS